MARVAHRYARVVEREEEGKLSWARIFNPRTVQFGKKLPEKRKV